MRDLRREVVLGCRARVTGLATRFESRTRDLLSQINALAADRPDLQRDALQWLFAVLEVGHAVIDLRHELAAPGVDPRGRLKGTPWRRSIATTLDAVARVFSIARIRLASTRR